MQCIETTRLWGGLPLVSTVYQLNQRLFILGKLSNASACYMTWIIAICVHQPGVCITLDNLSPPGSAAPASGPLGEAAVLSRLPINTVQLIYNNFSFLIYPPVEHNIINRWFAFV